VIVTEEFFVKRLGSVNLSERYAAAKALRYRGYSEPTRDRLIERMNDPQEDIYVQLEASAALAAHGFEEGWRFLEEKALANPLTVPLETQLETIIVASEITDPRSERLLISVLVDHSRDEELRAGAAWALGQFESRTSALALIGTFNANPLDIRVEAARALLRISTNQVPLLIEQLRNAAPSSRDGIAWVLARTSNVEPVALMNEASDANLRAWISYVIGLDKKKFSEEDLKAICSKDPEVYFAASVLWQIVQSWINQIMEY
jgi:HEAT repeat protein